MQRAAAGESSSSYDMHPPPHMTCIIKDCAAMQRTAAGEKCTGLVGGGLGGGRERGREKKMSALELSQRSANAAALYVTVAEDIRAHAASTKEGGGGNPSCVKVKETYYTHKRDLR
jgi:hypothetical protein